MPFYRVFPHYPERKPDNQYDFGKVTITAYTSHPKRNVVWRVAVHNYPEPFALFKMVSNSNAVPLKNSFYAGNPMGFEIINKDNELARVSIQIPACFYGDAFVASNKSAALAGYFEMFPRRRSRPKLLNFFDSFEITPPHGRLQSTIEKVRGRNNSSPFAGHQQAKPNELPGDRSGIGHRRSPTGWGSSIA